jgi:glycosyltransferase involved in cell wall biosynthesis
MKPTTITMCITELDVGGAEKAFVRIAQGLAGHGWNVRVISLRDRGPLAESLEAVNIPVTALECGGLADIRALFRLKRELSRHQPEVLLTFLHQANIVGRIAGRLAGVKTIVSGIRVADRRLAVTLPERMTRRLVDHYVAVSRNVATTHGELCGISPEHMSVILNGVDVEAIASAVPVDRSELGANPHDFIVLFVGRLTAQKAPEDLLNAFAAIPDVRSRACRLVFTGDGPLREPLQAKIMQLELQDKVRLTGWRPDIAGIMKSCNLLVLPSRWEGLPNVVLESAAAGLPVIASDVDGVRELIPEFTSGQLFPAGNIDRLRELMVGHINAASVGANLTQNSQPVSGKQFTWDSVASAYHQLLMRLTSGTEIPRN